MSAVEQSSGRLGSLSHTVGIATTAIASLGASYVVALQDPMPQWELDLTEWINGVPDGVATMQYPIMQFGTPGGPILVAAAVAIFRRDWWLSGATVVSGFVTWFGAKGVKKIVDRGRPGGYLSEINIREGDGTGLEHGVTLPTRRQLTIRCLVSSRLNPTNKGIDMDLRQKLIDLSREATGDPTITVAGDFQPKGMTWKVAAGGVAGSVLGDAAGGDVAQAVGAAAGYTAGRYAATSGELPPVIVLAASPTKLYLMTSNNAKGIILARHLLLIDTLDRENLSVEMHQKATVRTAVVTDNSTGHEYKLEGKRILFHHMNAMLDALAADDAADAEHETAVAAE